MAPRKIEPAQEVDLSTGRARMVFLRDWLDANVAPKPRKFNLGVWARLNRALKLGMEEENCSSVGCAVGWATTIPQFQALGLTIIERGDGQWIPVFEGRVVYDAVAEFFNLPKEHTWNLFAPDMYPSGSNTPLSEVLGRMDAYLEEHPSW